MDTRLEQMSVCAHRDQITRLVNRSPELVERHDRAAWLALFSSNAVLEDPVGAGPNRKGKDMRGGKDALDRFYDIFIGPNRIRFDVHQDIVVGNEMVREVSIHTTMPNGAVTTVHCYLDYRIGEEKGQFKIEMLRAHWDFGKSALALIVNNRFRGITSSLAQFGTMIRLQGVRRTIEYMGAMYNGIRNKGIRSAKEFATAFNAKDEARFVHLFGTGAVIHFPAGRQPLSASDFLRLAGKDVKLELRGLRSGGWFTSCAFGSGGDGLGNQGVAFFEFNPKSKKIVDLRFFWNHEA